jgi:Flp pilus assembly protein TadD
LKAVVKAQPQNADAWNLLAYSERKTDKLDDAMVHYMKALSIDPKHRDAHEYIGELYLRLGDLEGAKKHLKRLDDICTFGCEQFDELKEAIEAHGK